MQKSFTSQRSSLIFSNHIIISILKIPIVILQKKIIKIEHYLSLFISQRIQKIVI